MLEVDKAKGSWKLLSLLSLIILTVVTVVAIITKLWFLTAIPIGFLFGFFMQKGDLCGASAFSEVIMMKDRRKLFGLWILIVIAMVGFAILNLMGWVKLNPKPLLYLNYLVGGIIFGVGTVLAGGCVSGCMFKASTGNLNSIIAMLGIPVGVMMVEFGPLKSLQHGMKQHVAKMGDGGVVSLPAVLGIPFWVLAIIFGLLTIITVVVVRGRRRASRPPSASNEPWFQRVMTRPWKPWASGLAIGLLMIPGYLSSAASGRNYPLGVTHGVMQAELLLIDQNFNHIWKKRVPASGAAAKTSQPSSGPKTGVLTKAPRPSGKKLVWWLVSLCLSFMVGAWVSGRLSGQAKLKPKPPDEILIALIGGVLVGTGAAFATGCVVGNIMSGWALMSVGMLIFGVTTILANWATTYLYLMGGWSMRK